MAEETLQTELQYYTKHQSEYLKLYKGQFVLIKGEKLLGTYTTEAEAYTAGLELLGNQSFLIKQVAEDGAEISYPALTVGAINLQP